MRTCCWVALICFAITGMCAWTSWASGPGGPAAMAPAPLDPVLMGFKEEGVWYFLCEAPAYLHRIPPHFQTYGPPPPPCCPIPLAPAPCKVK